MKIIVGLGNPGRKYQNTRHNIGWQVADAFLEKKEEWKKDKKAQCFLLRKTINQEETIIAKPFTFMNNSGQTVNYLQKKHFLNSEDIIVIHDDLDIEFGKIKISQNHSAGGHNGIKSIINNLGNKNFIRIRIGIKPKNEIKVPLEKFVLKNFSFTEKKQKNEIIDLSKKAVIDIIEKGVNQAMTEYN